MMRIVALNEDSQDNNSNDLQADKVTKEAEETIAVSEYMRALQFKQNDKIDDALFLFLELLDTQVLHEVTSDQKDNKLFSVKYNCYRNIGFIYEQKQEQILALTHLVKAMELDDTDVYTMSKLGQLALNMSKVEIAKIAFEKCLVRNPNHWPSVDGILQILCLSGNINEAYGWALYWHKKDDTYERAIQVLMEICDRFSYNVPFFEKNWGGSFKQDEKIHKRGENSCFPSRAINELIDDNKPLNINYIDFKIEKLDWLSIGNLVLKLYQYLLDNDNSICSTFNLDDFLSFHPTEVTIQTEIVMDNINIKTQSLTRTNSLESLNVTGSISKPDSEEGDSQSKKDLPETDNVIPLFVSPTDENILSQIPDAEDKIDDATQELKPKARRRPSELSILEQWGWHKNRRSSRKKSVQPDQNETAVDTTINGFLKRIFSQFFIEIFDQSKQSPFIEDNIDSLNNLIVTSNQTPNSSEISVEQFQEMTESVFNKFLEELKSSSFDIFIPILKWLEYMSVFWPILIPNELSQIYLKIYLLYLNHFDLQTWSIMNEVEFQSAYSMMLFYVELEYQRITIAENSICKFSIEFHKKIHHLTAFSGFSHSINESDNLKTLVRLLWLQHNVALLENDLSEAIACIGKVEELMEAQNCELEIYLPNQITNKFFNLETITKSKISLERKFRLNSVKNLYENNKFSEIITIIKDSLFNISELKISDGTTLKIQTQFEVLLESLWNLENFEDCFTWAEKCLSYSLENFFLAPNETYKQREWAESVNFVLIYIEALLLQETNSILFCLDRYLGRLVQNLIKIVVHQLDSTFDKNNTQFHPINLKMPWIIIYQILQKEEDGVKRKEKPIVECSTDEIDIEDSIPNTFMLFFTAHDFLGRKSWCSKDNGQFLLYALGIIAPQIRAPILEPVRECVTEYVEQITYCLYGYPVKKARSRHIEEHDATQIELTWERAVELFDIYRPDNLPEFNSYKLESITAEMEQLLQKILLLVPKNLDPTPLSMDLRNFINGKTTELPDEIVILPSRIACIYYLLADYYFKNRDFSKTIKFYTLDLTMNPTRYDSWAGLALSKASKLETKLNSCNPINSSDIFLQSCETLRCFEQCVKLFRKQTLLWIEYGTFAYTIHAFCSRNLKQYSDTLSMEKFAFIEERKDECIKVAYNCFQTISKELSGEEILIQNSEDDQHDERWLHHYMLGKISEKKKEVPSIFLAHYLQSAKCLYENNATYPFKINHSNPQNLSIEALEIYYRISASIIKYLEQHRIVQRDVGKLFNRVLKELASSPFALNQAKIDDNSLNALKRKLAQNAEENAANKLLKMDVPVTVTEEEPISDIQEKKNDDIMEVDVEIEIPVHILTETVTIDQTTTENIKEKTPEKIELIVEDKKDTPLSPNRRGSQESNATTATTTTTTTGSSSSSSSSSSDSSDSSTSDSDSESSSDDENKKNTPFSDDELEHIYKCCIKNFEECVTRFPEHYKSVYRLVNYYLNAPTKQRNFDKSKQLLLGTYTTSLGNKLQGLFIDRKNNNFFNGIWRIPSSEIDRPGSFSSHLSKCVVILMEILKTSLDYNVLLDLALQLQRTPEPDKRYLKDSERKELFQQAISFCVQSFRSLLKKHSVDQKNDFEIINLLLDIFKSHRKCLKHIQQKEGLFSALLVDTYKAYVKDKIKLPENISILDLAVKLCQHEINTRKIQEKQGIPLGSHILPFPIEMPITTQIKAIPSPQPLPTPAAIPPTNTSVSIPTTSAIPIIINTVTPPTIQTSVPMSSSTKSINYGNNLPRPRGRPVGSKNSNPPSLLNSPLNLGNSYMDSATMAAVLSMYSNPNMMSSMSQFQDTSVMSSLLADYYSKLGFSSSAFSSLSNMSSLLGNQSVNLMGLPQSQQNQQILQTKSPKVSPQIETKKSIPSTSKGTINIGSQLTITATPALPHTSKLNLPENSRGTTGKQQKDKTMNSLPAVLKKDLTNQTFSSKIQEISGIQSNQKSTFQGIPHDLPKSLTITPTTSTYTDRIDIVKKNIQSIISSKQVKDSTKYVDKIKNVKKSNSSNAPYKAGAKVNISQSQSLSISNNPYSSLPGYTIEEYKRHISLLSSYAEAMQRSNPVSMTQPGVPSSSSSSTGLPKKTASYKKQSQKAHLTQPNVNKSPSGYINSPSPIPAHSPTKSPILGPRQSMTPPVSTIQPQQTKTLQQKLAEQKQKANASSISNINQNLKTSGGKSTTTKTSDSNRRKQTFSTNSDDDVIILE